MGRSHEEDSIPPNPNLYPEELQLKLYQAFIFSIPILFSIILFLLFYLFYLKRRANNNMSTQPPRIHSAHPHHSFLSTPWSMGIKGELKDKLHVILFDEELREKDALCCVCLGEFELKEELRQLPLCKHVFHGDCIRHWLRTNATCPLCRCPFIPELKMGLPIGLGPYLSSQSNDNFAPQQEQEGSVGSSTLEVDNSSRLEEHVIQIVDEPSSSSSSGSHTT